MHCLTFGSVLRLESVLRPYVVTPFRAPLLLTLVKYPAETVNNFLSHSESMICGPCCSPLIDIDEQYVDLFYNIIQMPNAGPIRASMMNQQQRLLDVFFNAKVLLLSLLFVLTCKQPATDPVGAQLMREGAKIIYQLAKTTKDWLPEQPALIQGLQPVWQSEGVGDQFTTLTDMCTQKRALLADDLAFDRRRVSRNILKCFMQYYAAHHDDFSLAFDMYA